MAQREFKRRTSVRKGASGTKRKKRPVSSAGKRKGGLFANTGDMIPGPDAIAKLLVWGSPPAAAMGGGAGAVAGAGGP